MSREVELKASSEPISSVTEIGRKDLEPTQSISFELNCANDSGFCEQSFFANRSYSFDNELCTNRTGPKESDEENKDLFDKENYQHFRDDWPVPRSSSTPNRIEISIDELWNTRKEETDIPRPDANVYHTRSSLIKSENSIRPRALQPIRESANVSYKVETLDVSDKEPVLKNSAEDVHEPVHRIKTENDNYVAGYEILRNSVDGHEILRNSAADDAHTDSGKDGTGTNTKVDKEYNDAERVQCLTTTAGGISVTENTESILLEDNEQETNCSGVSRKKQSMNKRGSRKSSTPKRSPTKCDPRFKGATVWLQTEYKEGRSRLNISAFYSNVKAIFSDGPRRSLFGSHVFSCSPDSYSFSDTEDSSTPPYGRETYFMVKTCASCHTRRTPLWRDAEDGTPLCNACGIRYKKYRLRCSKCWHIPKKDIKTYPNCPSCGSSLRYVFCRRTW